jgi:hypothetical protein
MPRGLIILAVAGALGAGGAAVARSDAGTATVCGPAAVHTLAASRQARVYASGAAVYGCARGGQPSIRLGARRSCIGAERIGPVTVTGSLAAYGSEVCGVDTGLTRVVVRRLTDGRQLHSSPATGPVGPEAYETVDSLVLKGDGAVAWIATGFSLGRRDAVVEVWRSDRHGTARLGSGAGTRPRSLRLTGSRLRWRDGSRTRTAALS